EIEKRRMPSIPFTSVNPVYFIQTASELTEGVHAYGARIFIQLTGGVGRVGNPRGLLSKPVAPSAIPNYWDPTITCREITTEEVERLVQAFGEGAKIALAAGFDGVEIHAVHEGYLIDQFTIAMFNRRTDKYGGDLKGRLTLPVEIVKEIKKEVGADFPVQLRYSIKSFIKDWRQGGLPGEEFKEVGRDTEEGLKAAKLLEAAGYDAFDADAGSYDAWYWAHPPLYQDHGCYLTLTERLKKVVNVPVIVAGRMEIPELAAVAIAEKKADMVALGRGLLAEPHWANKLAEGRIEKIRPCLACHDGCLGRTMLGRPLSCAVNPACGRERDYAIQPAHDIKSVMVIGGGVAGMEAARIAAIRGHKVLLYEKSDKLGGHLIEGSVPAFKRDVARLLKWYETELLEMSVEIHLEKEVSIETVLEKKPNIVVVATGSNFAFPDIPGIHTEKVITTTDLLLGKRQAKSPIIIIGGGLTGCETALWLAQQGKKVTIVEMLDEPMRAGIPVMHANRTMLIDLLKFHRVDILTNTRLLEVKDDGVELIDISFCRRKLHANNVIMAAGLDSDQNLFRSLAGKTPNVYLIGDAKQPRNIMYAIWDAYEVAKNV
ncbi:FAD-dependent oxidoreductase, partial [Chloroflexota bacterium]